MRLAERVAPYHAGYVVDASVVFKWFDAGRDEEHRVEAQALRSRFQKGTCALHAPELLLLEIGNIFKFNKAATEAMGSTVLEHLMEMGLGFHRIDAKLLQAANRLAWRHQITLYDALYLALAETISLPLVTADEKLLRLLPGHPFAIPLKSLS